MYNKIILPTSHTEIASITSSVKKKNAD